ncbi:hypothetical protein L2E82_11217 [Cichorium intybus]|uniref:Uncharacterized protein n=1 Tax=Cichorium intybus TaxID=13427 RepID=A0ACB9GC69_CICIN|nr:hypothetical protein L2E82_11217 [Cichorium intybus]
MSFAEVVKGQVPSRKDKLLTEAESTREPMEIGVNRREDVIITDPCLNGSRDWSVGLICVNTSILEVISETVEIVFDHRTFTIRVQEVDKRLCDYDTENRIEQEEHEHDEDEKEEESSEGEEAHGASDKESIVDSSYEEFEVVHEEHFIRDSSPEIESIRCKRDNY